MIQNSLFVGGAAADCKNHHFASLRVYITKAGNNLFYVYRAQCPMCKKIKYFNLEGKPVPGIYKLNGRVPDFKVNFWKEMKQFGLDPVGFTNTLVENPNCFRFDVESLPKRQQKSREILDY